MRQLFAAIVIIVALRGGTPAMTVDLKGFVPPQVTAAVVSYEYKRICNALAPQIVPDDSPLKVIYFTRKGTAHEDFSLPEWGGGGAIGTSRIVVAVDPVPFLEQDLVQTTVHEIAHIAINRIAGSVNVPRWFHEGVAMVLSRDISFEEHVIISRAIFAGRLMPLASIDSVNGMGPFSAQLAYCQSRQAVLFMVDTYGVESLAMVLHEARARGSFWEGVEAVLAVTPREFGALVSRYVNQRYGPVFWLADTYLLWLGIIVLFLVGYVLTMRRRRRREEEMEAEEARSALAAESEAPGPRESEPPDPGGSPPPGV